jgi:hypothetical protein
MSFSEKRTCIEPSPRNRIVQAGAIAMKPQSSKTIHFTGDAGLRSVCVSLDYHTPNLGSHSDFDRQVVRLAAMNVDYRGSRRGLFFPVPYARLGWLLHTCRHCACDRDSGRRSTSRLTGSTSYSRSQLRGPTEVRLCFDCRKGGGCGRLRCFEGRRVKAR